MSWAVGDVIALRLTGGWAQGLIVLHPAAYPPAIAFWRGLAGGPADAPRTGGTATFLMPLPHAETEAFRIVARGQPVPDVRFQLPVRDRTGRVLYRWIWDGTSITLGDGAETLPERRILSPDDLEAALAAP